MYVHDPHARLLLSSSGIRHIVLACPSLRVDGLGRIGKKLAAAFTVGLQMGRHGLTVTVTIPRLHYRLDTAFHGRLTVRPIRPTPAASKHPSPQPHKGAVAPRPTPGHNRKH